MKTFAYTIEGAVAWLRLNREKVLNALNQQFFEDLNHVLDELGALKSLRVLVITGTGKSFAAGADIAEMSLMNSAAAQAFSERGQQTFERLAGFPVPVISAINGFALGGGLELAMACDIRIASDRARFGQPEVSLGLIPGFGGTQRLAHLVGYSDAIYLLTTGVMIKAEEALRIGLVQKVVEHEKLDMEVSRMADVIVSRGPEAVRRVKEVTRMVWNRLPDQGTRNEADVFSSLFKGEGAEGMSAFLEKRTPHWIMAEKQSL